MSSQLSSNRIVSRESSERGESSSGSSESTSGSLGPTYDWVEIAVRNTATMLRKPDDLDKVIAKAPLVHSGLPSDIVVAEICGYTDRVCHGRENAPVDFFFVYNTLFVDLRVTLPFDEFTTDVLRFLNLAPTQLHPNSWACLQAYRMVCQLFYLTPRVEVFLFYYNTYPANPVSWVSLVSRPGSVCFAAFTTSYKNFKERYFKVFMEPDSREHFYLAEGGTKFPFHWTQNPTSLTINSRTAVSVLGKAEMAVFDQLPHKLPTRDIISLYTSSDPWVDFVGMLLCNFDWSDCFINSV